MKKIISIFFLHLIISSVSAQELINSFLNKYGKDETLNVVSIGKNMLQAIEELAANDQELVNALKGLDKIMIISCEDSDLSPEYYDSAYQMLSRKKSESDDLFTIKDIGENTIAMIKEPKGTIKELVLLSGEQEDRFNMIFLSGKIDLKTLSEYSDKLLPKLEKLNNVKNN